MKYYHQIHDSGYKKKKKKKRIEKRNRDNKKTCIWVTKSKIWNILEEEENKDSQNPWNGWGFASSTRKRGELEQRWRWACGCGRQLWDGLRIWLCANSSIFVRHFRFFFFFFFSFFAGNLWRWWRWKREREREKRKWEIQTESNFFFFLDLEISLEGNKWG